MGLSEQGRGWHECIEYQRAWQIMIKCTFLLQVWKESLEPLSRAGIWSGLHNQKFALDALSIRVGGRRGRHGSQGTVTAVAVVSGGCTGSFHRALAVLM